MNRYAAWILVLAACPPAAVAAEPARLPTTPQVPAPQSPEQAMTPAGGPGRVLAPVRERLGLVRPAAHAGEPVAAPVVPAHGPADCVGCAGDVSACGGSVIPGSPIKAWLCFRPTTGHELPWLRPHPYVGPITGQFRCSPAACPACEGAPACAPGAGCAKGIGSFAGRGCRDGVCVPPADDAFAGYKFAAPVAPSVAGRGVPAAAPPVTSYKPAVMPTGVTPAPQAVPAKTGTVLQSLRRGFGRP